MRSESITLVTGATGALGRLVVSDLIAAKHHVVAGTRHSAAILGDVPTRRIDFDDPVSLATGFAGVERLLIVSTDELSEPGKRQRQHAAALTAAVEAGIGFIAYTSMPDPANSPAIPFAPDHQAMEDALRASGVPHAVLRNGWYQENLLAYLPRIIADGTWYTAAGDGRVPYVARADAARAASSVLAGANAGVFDLAGPEALSVDNIAAAVVGTLGRPLSVVQVDEQRAALELQRQGVPTPVIPMVTSTEANQRAGRFVVGGGAVERLTGRASRPITDFLRNNAEVLLAPAKC